MFFIGWLRASRQQIHIPFDESLEQGHKRSWELPILHMTAPISLVGLVGSTMAAALLLLLLLLSVGSTAEHI